MEGLSLLMKDSLARGAVTGIKVSRLINILHLLFVDVVIIMSHAFASDWIEIVRLLGLFCKASGLSLNQHKTLVLFEGLTKAELDPFKQILPFSSSPLSSGLRYLGFHLKIGAQRASDWDWLIEKLLKKTGLWCNCWLSLGQRYILVKLVLEAQPIFWISMEALPRSILSMIRKVMFHFLWNGHSESQHYHLCRWEALSRPKKLGGWGFRNILFFNKALNTNTLWRLLK
jgi:hypothetical protein